VTRTIKLDLKGPSGRIELDGQDISKHVRAVDLKGDARTGAEVILFLTPLQVIAETDGVIKIPAEMEEILEKLGWTPPGSCALGCR